MITIYVGIAPPGTLMHAPRKLPRFQAANDTPKYEGRVRLSKNKLAYRAPSLKTLASVCVVLLFLGGITLSLWSMQSSSAPLPTIRPVALAQPIKPSEPAKLTDIILPASSLSPEIPLVDDRDVNIVASKIGDLPALNGNASVQIASDENDNHELLSRAHALLTAQNYDAALDLYNQVLATDQHNHDALSGKSFVLAASGADEEAIEALRFLLTIYPHDDVAEANLAHMLTKTGQNEEAITLLDRAAHDATDNLTYRLELAESYDRNDHRAEALMLYRQVVDASEREESIDLPLATIRQRINYLETPEEDNASDPSSTLPVD